MKFFVNHLDDPFRSSCHNQGLHLLLPGKEGICHPTGDKDGHHRIEGVLPAKEKACKEHDNPVDQKGNTAHTPSCHLANGQADNICSAAGNPGLEPIADTRSHDQTPKNSIDEGVCGQGYLGNQLDKEGTHGHSDKGKNGKFVTNLVPGQDQKGQIDSIKSDCNRNGKAQIATANGR